MASTLRNGSSGGEVAELQKKLNATGNYSLSTDGIFGSQTESAVRDYQARSGLSIDGIVGTQTWGSLTTPKAATTAVSPTTPAYTQSQEVTDASEALAKLQAPSSYTQSDAVTEALRQLTEQKENKPGAYTQSQSVSDAESSLSQLAAPDEYVSQYGDTIQTLIDGILNREKFSYDAAADPMYQMASEAYQRQGKLAMQDTMGQQAALTGGYGNSWAQSVGQQAYNNQLQQMNDVIPELQNAAYSRYSQEGSDMRSNLGVVQGLESTDYSRYADDVSQYEADRNYLANQYDSAYSKDYGQYRDTVGDYQNDLSLLDSQYQNASEQDYGQYRDTVGDYQTERDYLANQFQNAYAQDYGQYEDERDFAYQQERDAISDEQYQQEYNLAVATAAKKSSSGGSSKKSAAETFLDTLESNANLTEAQKTAMADQYFGIVEPKKTASYGSVDWRLLK